MPTTGGGLLIRDDDDGIAARLEEVRVRNAMSAPPAPPLAGPPEAIALRLAEYWRAGARGFIFGINPPYDRQTIERLMGEVKPRLAELIGSS